MYIMYKQLKVVQITSSFSVPAACKFAIFTCNFQNRLVKFKDFSSIFKDLICLQALSEALNF